MKFVCDRCQTRYSIADEKVRRKILRIRCKTCGNVIVVQDEEAGFGGAGPTVVDPHAAEAVRAASSSGPKAVPSSGPKAVPSSGPKAVPSSGPKAVPSTRSEAVARAPARPGAGGPPPLPRARKGVDPLGGHVEWYVAIEGVRSGPFSRAEAAKRIVEAGAGKETHVWKEGMSGWKPPTEVSVIARELSLLRPTPPSGPRAASRTPPPATPVASAGKPPAVKGEGPTPSPSSRTPQVSPAATPQVLPAAEASKAREAVDSSDEDIFGEVTTQKSKSFRDLATKPTGSSFGEVTTKKGKNLRDLETESLYTPEPNLGEGDVTPPPAQPLPPVGTKVPAHAPAPKLPTSVARAASRAAPTVPGSTPTPLPADLAAPFVSLTPPRAAPEAPLGAPTPLPAAPLPSSASPAITPVSPLVASVTPVAPMVAQPSSSGPVFTEGGLPTPQPMGVPSFGDTFAAAPPAAMAPPKPGLAGLLERQPGLKYVFAALAIVVLIILLVLVILRGEREEADEPASPAQAEPGKVVEPEAVPAETPSPPPVAEEAKATPPLPSSPPVAEEPKVAPPPPSPPPAGKRGFRRGGRRAAIRAPRPPKDRSTASPPRLSGARPNPFEDSKNVSQSQITAVVRNPANQAALKSCYERALKVDNRLTSGRIDVTVSIGMSGAVRRVVINAPSSFILVEPCIKAAVKRWKFPANNEEYATSFPLILQGGM